MPRRLFELFGGLWQDYPCFTKKLNGTDEIKLVIQSRPYREEDIAPSVIIMPHVLGVYRTNGIRE